MRTRHLAGREVPILGQGTWLIEHDPEAVDALKRGLDLGMTHIDTAEMYGSERIVGEAIQGRRDEVFLVSKVLPSNASRRGAVRACERSLECLGTETLDLYLLHWPGSHPLEETFAAFDELRQAGKIQAYGVSNFDVEDLDAVWALAGANLACNQVIYHLRDRAIEHRVVPWCQRHGVAIVGYSPFGQGSFPEPSGPSDPLESIAMARGATRRQIALAYLTRHPSTFTIPKAGKLSHVEENAGAGGIVLTENETRSIERAFLRSSSHRLGML